MSDKAPTTPPEQRGRRRLADSFLLQRDMIIPDPNQPRQEFDESEMLELTDSIRERGIKQPITVRWSVDDHKYMIIDGGRRFEAASRLKVDELPCWIREETGKDVLIDQIVHNWQRSELRPYETADALVRLRDEFNLTQRELARQIGKSEAEISKHIALRDKVIPEVQKIARTQPDSRLSRRHLYNIAKLKPDKQLDLAQKVGLENLTADQTEQIVKSKSPTVRVTQQSGLATRQRRFKAKKADVVITFRKRNVQTTDILEVLDELTERIRQKLDHNES